MLPSFTIILPTYNERENVPLLIEEILQLNLKFQVNVLLVDDDSPDGTAEIVSERFKNNSMVQVLKRVGVPHGLVHSLNDGIANVKTDFLMWMDADLQMPSQTIPEIISCITQNDVTAVIGSRFINGGSDSRVSDKPTLVIRVHQFLSKLLNVITPVVLELKCTDITSGFIAVRTDYFKDRKLSGNHGEYFITLMNDLSKNHKLMEIPYKLIPRTAGISKSTQESWLHMFITGTRYVSVVLRLYLKNKTK